MMLPDFSEFKNDVGKNGFQDFTDILNDYSFSAPATPEEAKQFAEGVVSISMRATLEMLQAYHEWLTVKLDAQKP